MLTEVDPRTKRRRLAVAALAAAVALAAASPAGAAQPPRPPAPPMVSPRAAASARTMPLPRRCHRRRRHHHHRRHVPRVCKKTFLHKVYEVGTATRPWGPMQGPVGPPQGQKAAATNAVTHGNGLDPNSTTSTLILYDTTNQWGWLGQTYATMTANLVSHFGSWTAEPVSSYQSGQVNNFTATIYIGSTYDEPLPTAWLDDVESTSRPVIWMYDNIWQLTSHDPNFASHYGWMWSYFDSCSTCPNTTPVNEVDYKGQQLSRSTLNNAGIMNYSSIDPSKVQVLADAKRTDGSTFPWAIRSGNLTYIGEIPFAYFSEGDRLIAFEDMLFDALAPNTVERHRAMVRLEDISPVSDPADLRADADYLASQNVPFSFGVIPRYKDPNGYYNDGTPETITLKQSPGVVAALKYMQQKGGVMIDHGWTHQYKAIANPYSGVSGDDFEFYRVTANPDYSLNYLGPVPGDSTSYAQSRYDGAVKDFQAAKLPVPQILEFPHYAASVTDYRFMDTKFRARYERALYPYNALTGGTPDYTRLTGQMFPYPVRDVYGEEVLPENVGNIEPQPFFTFPTRLPADIIRDAQRNLAIRDGFASFYFHPFWDISYLKQTVEGLKSLGYTFVSPTSLLQP